jgi:23S rRNA (uracil1939-C5)-methyltransferase
VTAEILIEKLVAGGDGLGFLNGKAVFVPGVLPGETVKVRLSQHRRDFARGAVIEVAHRSPHRQAPPCGLAGICGGCDWLHIRYKEQLAQKAAIVREAFRRVGHFSWETISVHAGPELGYRNRVQMHRDHAGRLGFMAGGGRAVVPVAVCPVSVPGINGVFARPARAPSDRDRFTVWGEGDAAAIEGIDDRRDIVARVDGKDILFSVGCFFQSNLAVLSKLVSFAIAGLSGGAAADLYCGVGLFGAFLAESFAAVTAVESSSLSMSYARRNIVGSANDFFPVSVEQWIEAGAPGGPFGAVVVDPPRAGLAPEVRGWLLRAKPTRLVYVSCNPVTLARDLGELAGGGFALAEVGLFDFFPHTSHVETVARLRYERPPA